MMNKKLKIGLVCIGYQCEKNLVYNLSNWIRLKWGIRDDLGCTIVPAQNDVELKICCVSALFKERQENGEIYNNDKTSNILSMYEDSQAINKFIEVKDPILDFESRNYAWDYLKQFNPDLVWELDLLDEYYDYNEIIRTINWIKNNNLYDFYRIRFKNYFGRLEDKTWVDDFTPTRILWNTKNSGIKRFYWDNDAEWQNGAKSPNCSNIIIPKSICHPRHESWIFDDRYKAMLKINYQFKALGTCSYRWDDNLNKLVFSLDYYNKFGIPVPEVYKD